MSHSSQGTRGATCASAGQFAITDSRYCPAYSNRVIWLMNEKLSCATAEKAMASHSSTLAWKIPWAEESGRLQSMGLQRVGHDEATSLSLFTFMHWRRKWQPTPVFLPGESQGRGSLVSCHLYGCRVGHD